jgi:hypothetical protein
MAETFLSPMRKFAPRALARPLLCAGPNAVWRIARRDVRGFFLVKDGES